MTEQPPRSEPFRSIGHLLAMIRFSHTLFALPFALLAAVMAWSAQSAGGQSTPFRLTHLIGIVLCMVFARSAAMALNRLADRHIDAQNPRTAKRHLPAGILSVRSVAAFTLAMSFAFVASTLLFLPNRVPVALAIPVLLFLFAYSYTKRFTAMAHFCLGASLMLAPICAWLAIRGEIVVAHPADLSPAALLGVAVMLWVAGFDVIYACQDVDFDRRSRLRSIPARLGVPQALRLAAFSHFLMIGALALLPLVTAEAGLTLGLGWIYWTTITLVAVLLIYEHCLVRPDDLTRVNVAFFQVNAVISLGLFAIVTLDLIWI